MNEKIKKLAEQAGFPPARAFSDLSDLYPRLDRFAELIVQDVMNLFGDERISLHYLEQPCCEDSVYLLQFKLKQHFGVEE